MRAERVLAFRARIRVDFTPQAFGKYFLVDKIATGGMAEIFKAKTYSHGGFENLLVIKRILPHVGANADFVEMFIDEAKVSVALQHANIVRVFDFGNVGKNYFIAMECVEGKDVRNLLRKLAKLRQRLRPAYAAYLALEVCKALQYAHTRADPDGKPYHIVHRDISPSNVLISYEGDVKVADFGIAKARFSAYQTRDGVLKGKYEYMSPEQADGQPIDGRSDLFSLGILLHECLTGRRLFKNESDQATLAAIRRAEVPAPSLLNPVVPRVLDEICLRALARNPEDRYDTAAQMADDLRRYLHPLTPDELSQEVGRFMGELFHLERTAERRRLQRGSDAAQRMRESAPESWDGSDSTFASPNPPQNQALVPLLLGVAIGLTGVVIVGGATLAWVVFTQLDPPDIEPIVQSTPAPARIEILVLPAAQITVNGADHGVQGQLSLSDLPSGRYTVRLHADGYTPVQETIVLHEGQSHFIRQTLQPLPPEPAPVSTPPPRSAPRPAPEAASPAPQPAPVAHPAPLPAPARITPPAATPPGSLTITLGGGGWAYVSIDGQRLDKTAPLKEWPLAAGTYLVRLENPALGLDRTEQITVQPGEEWVLRAAAP